MCRNELDCPPCSVHCIFRPELWQACGGSGRRHREKSLMDIKVGEKLGNAVAALKAAGAREVFLFGSGAKESLRESSDVDLAVSGLPPDVFFRAMAAAHDALGRPLDLIDLDEDNPFTRYLKDEGELRRVG